MGKNNCLFILVGMSASGKTTYCENQLIQTKNLIRVSRDEYRYMWRNEGVVVPQLEELITIRVEQDITDFLNKNYNVIYDATNLNLKYLNELVEKYKILSEIKFVIFNVDLEECIKRDKQRKRRVGEEVIKKQHNGFVRVTNFLYENMQDSILNPSTNL